MSLDKIPALTERDTDLTMVFADGSALRATISTEQASAIHTLVKFLLDEEMEDYQPVPNVGDDFLFPLSGRYGRVVMVRETDDNYIIHGRTDNDAPLLHTIPKEN